MMQRIINPVLYILNVAIGLGALLYPFFWPALIQPSQTGLGRASEMPLMLTVILSMALLVLLYLSQSQTSNPRLIALLGVLVAINASLRFIETVVPGPGGFTPIFFLIILTGYEFGGQSGFLMGALTLLVSAILTGGVGPWLPAQMLTAGWVGLTAPLCRPLVQRCSRHGWNCERLILIEFGIFWGFLYGLFMNLWSWPFMSGPPDQYWQAGIGWQGILARYAMFYVVTSLFWDCFAAAGNAVLIFLFGIPVLRSMRRFHKRFQFEYQPEVL